MNARRTTLSLVLLISALLVASAAPGPPRPGTLPGDWESKDPVDGSHQVLLIDTAGNADYFDEGASFCGMNPGTGKWVNPIVTHEILDQRTGRSRGQVFAALAFWCDDFSDRIYPVDFIGVITAEGRTETFTDNFGAVWTRCGDPRCGLPRPPR